MSLSRVLIARRGLLVRRNPYCRYCGASLTVDTASFDHIIPRSRGGTNRRHNLALACKPCNRRKDDWLPEELLAWAQRIVNIANGQQSAPAEGGAA